MVPCPVTATPTNLDDCRLGLSTSSLGQGPRSNGPEMIEVYFENRSTLLYVRIKLPSPMGLSLLEFAKRYEGNNLYFRVFYNPFYRRENRNNNI